MASLRTNPRILLIGSLDRIRVADYNRYMNCPDKILPTGTPVVATTDPGYQELGGHRPGGAGVIAGIRGGMGGDVYLVRHGTETASYCFTELELDRRKIL